MTEEEFLKGYTGLVVPKDKTRKMKDFVFSPKGRRLGTKRTITQEEWDR